MDQQTKMALAAGVAGGYVLGRTKKGRVALTAAALVMGRSADPRGLMANGMRKLADMPQVASLGGQLKGEVFQAGRAALTAAADRRLGSLTDTLRDHTPVAGGEASGTPAEPDSADTSEEEPADTTKKEAGERPARAERPRARRATRDTPRSGQERRTARRTPPGNRGTAPAKKATTKPASGRKPAAERSAGRSSDSGRR